MNDYQKLVFRIVGCVVLIECRDQAAAELIRANYAAMQIYHCANPDLVYAVWRRNGSQFCVARQGREPITAADEGELLFVLEKELTIELQKIRRELYFIHAAALSFAGQGFLIAAPSGTGKSTTTWALLHHGFDYLSDELAPVDLSSLRVQPYPHALCLKKEPPLPYSLPAQSVRTCSTLHVPVARLPNSLLAKPALLSALFFLEHCPELKMPTVDAITKAEAAARLFVNALNPLAHEQDGLAGAAVIAQRVPSFHLKSAALGLTCELVKSILDKSSAANLPESFR
ncbi:MAG TPA: hypothetical protein VF182_23865 [Candidatus Binatia bacterium]